MDLGANKTPIKLIEEGAFGGTYFRDIYSNVGKKWYKNSWKEFDRIKNIDAKLYASDYYGENLNKCKVKIGTSLRFWEDKGWFQCYFRYQLGRKSKDGERQIDRWKEIVIRFRGKLVKIIKDTGSKFNDYSISPKIRQILLHWGYELTEEDVLTN